MANGTARSLYRLKPNKPNSVNSKILKILIQTKR